MACPKSVAHPSNKGGVSKTVAPALKNTGNSKGMTKGMSSGKGKEPDHNNEFDHGKKPGGAKDDHHAKHDGDDGDDDREWPIAKISSLRRAQHVTDENQGFEYLVHWADAGYEPTWIPTCNITSAALHSFWIAQWELPTDNDTKDDREHPHPAAAAATENTD